MHLRKLVNFRKDAWEGVKTRCSPAVVSIEMIYPRPLTRNESNYGVATGFIVDKHRGILLTNKHVVTDGPVRAKARFLKNEEIDLTPMYRDPEHDFAFFSFDPSLLAQTTLNEIDLFPDGSNVGEKVLVIGSNGGEKLGYVESTLARLDKTLDHPQCYNTFFVSATDLVVEGASGGPVLNQSGEAVALVCCGMEDSNSSFYLPLHRPLRVLQLLKLGVCPDLVPRGTLQIAFAYKTYEEASRYGVPDEFVANLRASDVHGQNEGLLLVHRILTCGSGYRAGLRNGDVLVSIKECLVLNFVDMSHLLDSNVGQTVDIKLFRRGVLLQLEAKVQDLKELCCDEYIEVSDAILHSVEYPLALEKNLELEGVYIKKLGYMFKHFLSRSRQYGAPILLRMGKFATPNLDSFQKALEFYPNGTQVSVVYVNCGNSHQEVFGRVIIDKRWYPFVRAKRKSVEFKKIKVDDTLLQAAELFGEDSLKVIENGPHPREHSSYAQKWIQLERTLPPTERDRKKSGMSSGTIYHRSSSKTQSLNLSEIGFSTETVVKIPVFGDVWNYNHGLISAGPNAPQKLSLVNSLAAKSQDLTSMPAAEESSEATFQTNPIDCIAFVEFKTPFPLDATTRTFSSGIGLVYDADLGLMICERVSVPSTLGDFFVTFNSAKTVKAKVVFVHPFSEFSIIQYDTAEVKVDKLCGQVRSLPLSEEDVELGMKLEYFGLSQNQDRLVRDCRITKVLAVSSNSDAVSPQPVAKNLDCFYTDVPRGYSIGGIYVTSDGKVAGFNHYFGKGKKGSFNGLKAIDVLPYVNLVRDSLIKGEPIPRSIKLLPAQLSKIPLVEARATLNLSDEWSLRLLETMGKYSRSLLTVSRLMFGSNAERDLRERDLVLAINGEPVTQFTQVLKICNQVIEDFSAAQAEAKVAVSESLMSNKIVDAEPSKDEKESVKENDTGSVLSRPMTEGRIGRSNSIVKNFNNTIRSLGRLRPRSRRQLAIAPVENDETHGHSQRDTARDWLSTHEEKDPSKVSLNLTVLRDRKVLEVPNVQIAEVSCVGTERIIIFAGMVLQRAHEEIRFIGVSFLSSMLENAGNQSYNGVMKDFSGVYVTKVLDGSPAYAEQYSAEMNRANCLITHVNGEYVSNLDDFLNRVAGVVDSEYVSLGSVDVSSGAMSVYSLRLDLEYWKTRDLMRDQSGEWREEELSSTKFAAPKRAKEANEANTKLVEVSINQVETKDKEEKVDKNKQKRYRQRRKKEKEKEKDEEEKNEEEKEQKAPMKKPQIKKVPSAAKIKASNAKEDKKKKNKNVNRHLRETYRKTRSFFNP